MRYSGETVISRGTEVAQESFDITGNQIKK